MKYLMLFFFLLNCFLLHAKTYYVSEKGDNINGNGTLSNPWTTLAYACSKVTTPGDTIFINEGTITETSQSNLAVGVSIKGTGAKSIISSTYSATEASTIRLNSTSQGTNGNQSISYIKMDGNSLKAHVAIEVNARSNVKIYNCEIVNFLRWGVIFNGLSGGWGSSAPTTYATGNEIYNTTITNCAGYADGWGRACIGVGGQLGFFCHHNTITQPQRGAIGTYGWPWKYYSEGYNKGTKIYNNTFTKAHYLGYDPDWDFAIEICMHEQGGLEIYNNEINGAIDLGARRKGDYEYSAYIHHNTLGQVSRGTYREAGIVLENVTEDLIIRYNYFRNVSHAIGAHTSSGGGEGDHMQRIYIQYNIFHEIGLSYEAWILYCYQGGSGSTWSDIYIENNVCMANPSNKFGYAIQFSPDHNMSNWYIRNNIFVGWYNAYIIGYGSNTEVDYLYTDNNIMYGCGNSNNPSWESPFNPTNWSNTNSIKSNPIFVGGSPYSYELQSGSPARDAGLDIGLTRDYRNYSVPYNNVPDIGAYEYGSSPASEIVVPTILTTPITLITTSSASSGGYVNNDGGGIVSVRGVCWGESSNPTISNNKTTDGSGTGRFQSSVTSLTSNTIYFLRAYATNEKGTGYGPEIEFKTLTENKSSSFDVTIYPNPAQGYFNIKISGGQILEPLKLKIIDFTGRIIKEITVLLDIDELIPIYCSSGIYTLQLSNNNFIMDVKKLIISH